MNNPLTENTLNDSTTFHSLKEKGAETLGDIPMQEILAYVRHSCLEVAKDMGKNGEDKNEKTFSTAASYIHAAMSELGEFYGLETAE